MSLIHQLLGDETYDPFLSTINKCPVLSTPTDWKETKDCHVFISDLPGLKKDENNTWHRIERCRGKFQRRFRLPENAKVDHVKASMENGVLVVTIPKQEVKKPETKVIQIEGS
uniref:17.5 kDa class I heat shock protein n=1 Tax=Cajanus cajan TaxID=3821 RepID=A0A151TYI3_CAJCA|nr:17.5 kDa class I heat shock protein [Cajanus cajan]